MYRNYTAACGSHIAFTQGADRYSTAGKSVIFDGRDVSQDATRSWTEPSCFADGRLVPKELIRRTRDEVVTQWWLQCVSPLNERFYLHAERQPLDDPDHFKPTQVHRSVDGAPRVFACALRQGATQFFPLVRDPWTGVSRYAALRTEPDHDVAAWLSQFDAGESPLDFLPRAGAWHVFEIGADGQPWSAWRTDRREWLVPVEVTPG